jgi:hypothetical protein
MATVTSADAANAPKGRNVIYCLQNSPSDPTKPAYTVFPATARSSAPLVLSSEGTLNNACAMSSLGIFRNEPRVGTTLPEMLAGVASAATFVVLNQQPSVDVLTSTSSIAPFSHGASTGAPALPDTLAGVAALVKLPAPIFKSDSLTLTAYRVMAGDSQSTETLESVTLPAGIGITATVSTTNQAIVRVTRTAAANPFGVHYVLVRFSSTWGNKRPPATAASMYTSNFAALIKISNIDDADKLTLANASLTAASYPLTSTTPFQLLTSPAVSHVHVKPDLPRDVTLATAMPPNATISSRILRLSGGEVVEPLPLNISAAAAGGGKVRMTLALSAESTSFTKIESLAVAKATFAFRNVSYVATFAMVQRLSAVDEALAYVTDLGPLTHINVGPGNSEIVAIPFPNTSLEGGESTMLEMPPIAVSRPPGALDQRLVVRVQPADNSRYLQLKLPAMVYNSQNGPLVSERQTGLPASITLPALPFLGPRALFASYGGSGRQKPIRLRGSANSLLLPGTGGYRAYERNVWVTEEDGSVIDF